MLIVIELLKHWTSVQMQLHCTSQNLFLTSNNVAIYIKKSLTMQCALKKHKIHKETYTIRQEDYGQLYLSVEP